MRCCCRCCCVAHHNQLYIQNSCRCCYGLRFFPHRDSCLRPLLLFLFRHDDRQALSTLTRPHDLCSCSLRMLLIYSLLIEVYCNYLFMVPVLPLQQQLLLLPLTFAAAIAVVVLVVPSLPFPFALHVFFLYSACQGPFLEPVSGCPSDSAVAVDAAKKDVRVCQHN